MTSVIVQMDQFVELNYTNELSFLNKNKSKLSSNILFNEYKNIIKKEIINQFSLETLFNKMYTTGANVTTVRNAKDGIFKSSEEKNNYNRVYSRNDIDRDVYRIQNDGSKELLSMGLQNLNKYTRKLINEEISSVPDVIKTRKKAPSLTEKNTEHVHLSNSATSQIEDLVGDSKKRKGKITDGYNMSKIYSITKDNKDPVDVDHIVSAKEIFDNDFLRLKSSPDELSMLANHQNNLTFTNQSANRSKGEKPLLAWANNKSKKNPSVINAERFDINLRDAQKKDEQARNNIKKFERKLQFQEYGIKGTKEGVKEGTLMGLKQSLGLFMLEFTNILSEELKKYFKNFKQYTNEETRFEEFVKGCNRVKEKMKASSSQILTEFSTGFISGFINNFMTIFINQVKTTSKRVNRLLSESFLGVVEGVKALASNDNDKYKKALIVFSSTIVGAIGGIATEALVSYLKTTPFALFAEVIGATVGGILTGLAVVTVVNFIQNYKQFLEDFKAIFKRDELTQEEIKLKVEEILENIEEDYKVIVDKIYKQYVHFTQVTQKAFDTSISPSHRLSNTVIYAEEFNVAEENIVTNHEEIDAFFLD